MAGALETPLSDLQKDTETNVYGVVRLTQAALPLLKKGKGKKIIVVGSILGTFGNPYASLPAAGVYSATKSAIHMWTRKVAAELGEGWTVVPFHPGYVACVFLFGATLRPLAHTPTGRTDMNGKASDEQRKYMITPDEAGKSGASVFLKLGPKDTNQMWTYEHKVVPW